jgi:phosphate:Na+ symporter
LNRYADEEEESLFISKVPVSDTDLALEALQNETKNFISHVIDYCLDSFNLNENIPKKQMMQKTFLHKTIWEQYDYLKHLHGEMHGFCLKLQNTSLNKPAAERLNQLIASVRNSMYAAKNIKDAQYDIEQIRNSSNDIKYSFYLQSREKLLIFYKRIQQLLNKENGINYFEELAAVYQSVTAGYSASLQSLYKESLANRVNEMEISTLINFNRELYTSFKSVLFGLKDYLLTSKEADYFDALPGFIR